MTNTLHRFGTAKSFSDDIIVFALPALGKCGQDEALPVLRRFLEIALEYGPVNIGDARSGGVVRHSLSYSLGFEGIGDNVPNKQAIMLSTMCGHGMIAHSFAKKMIDFVKEGRRSPEDAAASLQRFCSCGIFNTTRARRI